eukprot:4600329-Alexandrium_andersonii.AAC.1
MHRPWRSGRARRHRPRPGWRPHRRWRAPPAPGWTPRAANPAPPDRWNPQCSTWPHPRSCGPLAGRQPRP